MTTKDPTPTEARFDRLEACEGGDTITVPDDWQLPDSITRSSTLANVRPGDVYTHDGGKDRLPWNGPAGYLFTLDLADAGLEPDKVVARWNALGDVPRGHVAYLDEPTTFPADAHRLGIGPGIMIAKAKRLPAGWALTDADGCTFHAREEQVDALGFTPGMFRAPGARVVASDAVPEGIAIAGDFGTKAVTPEELDATPEADGPADDAIPLGTMSADGIELDPVDPAVVPEDTRECCGCETCAALCGGCPACEPDTDEDEESTSIGHVHVTVAPDTTLFRERLDELGARTDELLEKVATLGDTYVLDEYQRERVAALEQALRVLESRRAAKGAEPGSLASMFGKRAEVPMVGKRDLVDVAAFIADGDTGRAEVSA